MEKYAFGWCLLHGFDFSCCLLLPDIHQSCNITYVVDIFMEKNLRSAGLKPSMATTLHSRASCECHTRFYWQLQWLRFIYTVITTVKILSQGMRNAKGQESTQNTHTAEALGFFLLTLVMQAFQWILEKPASCMHVLAWNCSCWIILTWQITGGGTEMKITDNRAVIWECQKGRQSEREWVAPRVLWSARLSSELSLVSRQTRQRARVSVLVTVHETFHAGFRTGFLLTRRPSLHKARSQLWSSQFFC